SEVQKFTRNDPIKIPGQARSPNKRRQPRARPAAGQTAVAYPGGIARMTANLPAAKYVAAVTRMLPIHLMVENRSGGAGPEWDCSVTRPGDIGSSGRRRYATRPGFSSF